MFVSKYQGGKSSRIVNCVLALKSYNDWKQGGGKAGWKFGGNSKPASSGKQFVRKNSELFVNSLSRSSSTREKSLDSLSTEQSSFGDLVQDLNEMVCLLIAPTFTVIVSSQKNFH